jgi:hypothetical protein
MECLQTLLLGLVLLAGSAIAGDWVPVARGSNIDT